MNALLVRVGADLSDGGGHWNGPVNLATTDFAYVPIPETRRTHPGLKKPYSTVIPALKRFGCALPARLARKTMHLDPDFSHLTYGDQGQRALQISTKLKKGDLLVFYAALRDLTMQPRLTYALIGLYVIQRIESALSIPRNRWKNNAHTRRILPATANDIVVTAQPGVSGRLTKCLPIGSFRTGAREPHKRPCYRVAPNILKQWGGLSVSDGYLQRSARLPQFLHASKFLRWFSRNNPKLVATNF